MASKSTEIMGHFGRVAARKARRGTRVHYADDRNPRDPYAFARKQAAAWAGGTLHKLGIAFEAEDGVWYVCAFDGWAVAETAGELAEIARRCLEVAREMDRAEGPVGR